jgi:ATP adenylyltransferase
MDRLWSPWRYRYVQSASPKDDCIFCTKSGESRDDENYIVHRAEFNFVLLNLYPYTNGHLMIAPYTHAATLEETAPATLTERHLRALYKPDGVNLGMNIGAAGGAGVAGHIHMHVLPRWIGDASFMTTVGETRVLPEELGVTYARLRKAFAEA